MDSHTWKDGEAEVTIQRDTTVFVVGTIDRPHTYSIVAELLRLAEENRRLREMLLEVIGPSGADFLCPVCWRSSNRSAHGHTPDCRLDVFLRQDDPQGPQEAALQAEPDKSLDVDS